MGYIFENLALAVTFSPTGFALLKETARLKNLFNSALVLIHVGKRDSQTEISLDEMILKAGLVPANISILWEEGDPAAAILRSCKKAGIDLLIAGALEKENIIKYYIGSVARKLMREADFSTLILKAPKENPGGYKYFFASTDYSPESERTIRIAYNFALLENAEEFVVVKDYHIPGLASTILESGSAESLEAEKRNWQKDEEEKMNFFIRELSLKGIPVRTKCIYGREGWEASNYARGHHADIFAISGPQRRFKLIDRLFPHEAEYSFEKLPSNLLIIR